jgi:hypothetical protein
MNHTTIITPRHVIERGAWHPDPPDPSPARCPGCGSALRIDPEGSADPDWLVGTCRAPHCGEIVVYRVCEQRLIVADRRKPAARR